MSKQIVTLLYLNGITDFTKVEKYLGMNDEGYYEIIYDGELRKMRMPGVVYSEDIASKEYIEEKIEELDQNIEKNDFIFPDSLDSAVESAKNQDVTVHIETYTMVNDNSFEEELEKTEKENEKFLEKVKDEPTKKKESKISGKKIKIVESKDIDDGIDDFINTI